jgi:hypothetical protein
MSMETFAGSCYPCCIRTKTRDEHRFAGRCALLLSFCYLTRFPDVRHHLLEDRMIERLPAKKALTAESGHEIEEQHTTLIQYGRYLLRDQEAATRVENMSQEFVDTRIQIYAEWLIHNIDPT